MILQSGNAAGQRQIARLVGGYDVRPEHDRDRLLGRRDSKACRLDANMRRIGKAALLNLEVASVGTGVLDLGAKPVASMDVVMLAAERPTRTQQTIAITRATTTTAFAVPMIEDGSVATSEDAPRRPGITSNSVCEPREREGAELP